MGDVYELDRTEDTTWEIFKILVSEILFRQL